MGGAGDGGAEVEEARSELGASGRRRRVVEEGGVRALVGVMQAQYQDVEVVRGAAAALLALEELGGGGHHHARWWRRALVEVHEARGDSCVLSTLAHLARAGAWDVTASLLRLLQMLLQLDAQLEAEHAERCARHERVSLFGHASDSNTEEQAGAQGEIYDKAATDVRRRVIRANGRALLQDLAATLASQKAESGEGVAEAGARVGGRVSVQSSASRRQPGDCSARSEAPGKLSQCLELCEGELMCCRLRLYVCKRRNVACTLYYVT